MTSKKLISIKLSLDEKIDIEMSLEARIKILEQRLELFERNDIDTDDLKIMLNSSISAYDKIRTAK